MLLMETMSHSLYFNSIAKHKLWQRYGAQLRLSAADMGMISFWVLMFVWLKVGYCLRCIWKSQCAWHFVHPRLSIDGRTGVSTTAVLEYAYKQL